MVGYILKRVIDNTSYYLYMSAGEIMFSTDMSRALRFSRKQDVESFLPIVPSCHLLEVVEHR